MAVLSPLVLRSPRYREKPSYDTQSRVIEDDTRYDAISDLPVRGTPMTLIEWERDPPRGVTGVRGVGDMTDGMFFPDFTSLLPSWVHDAAAAAAAAASS